MTQIQLVPLTEFEPNTLRDVMLSGEPYVAARSASDYWAYGRFFSSTCFCAQYKEELIGVLIAFYNQDFLDEIYIQDILVHPNYRNQGVTRALLRQLEEVAISTGSKKLWLTSEPDNIAVKVWQRLGFVNPKADYEDHGLNITANLKGHNKDRAVFEKRVP